MQFYNMSTFSENNICGDECFSNYKFSAKVMFDKQIVPNYPTNKICVDKNDPQNSNYFAMNLR